MCVCGGGGGGSKYPTLNGSSTTSVQPRMHRAALATQCALGTTQTFCSFFKHSLMYSVRYIKTRSAAPCRLEGREEHASFSTGQLAISTCNINLNITVPLTYSQLQKVYTCISLYQDQSLPMIVCPSCC